MKAEVLLSLRNDFLVERRPAFLRLREESISFISFRTRRIGTPKRSGGVFGSRKPRVNLYFRLSHNSYYAHAAMIKSSFAIARFLGARSARLTFCGSEL